VLMKLEDYGFCGIGEGGAFVAEGNIRWPGGSIPVLRGITEHELLRLPPAATDGGSLCRRLHGAVLGSDPS
jgi:hypothetical protein